MALTTHDRDLLRRCLHHEPGAWNDFVDRFLGLIYHVIEHTADARSFTMRPEDTEDVAAQVLLEVVNHDYQVLRQFRGESSLAAYLTVVARRTAVNELARRAGIKAQPQPVRPDELEEEVEDHRANAAANLDSVEEVQKLMQKLPGKERSVVKLYFLEGRSYEEISTELDIPVNSIGAILSRARKKMRKK